MQRQTLFIYPLPIFREAFVMAGNQLIFKSALYQIMEEKERRPGLHFFNLGPTGDCTRSEVLQIRRLFIQQLKDDTCLECCRCNVLLTKVVFVVEELNSFCIDCFEKEPALMQGSFMFVNLGLDDPDYQGWTFSQQLELLYKAHEMGTDDLELLASSMTLGKKTAADIQKYFDMIEVFIPDQPALEVLKPQEQEKKEEKPVKKRKETWLQLFYRLKKMLDELDAGMLYYLMGELYDRVQPESKQPVLKEFIKIINFREQLYPFIQKLCQEYRARKFAASSSCSQSSSESFEPQEGKRKTKEVVNKRSKKQQNQKKQKKLKKDKKNKKVKKDKKSIRSEVPAKAPRVKAIQDKAPTANVKEMKTKKITRSTRVQLSSSCNVDKKRSGKILEKQPSLKPEKKTKAIKLIRKLSDEESD